MKQPAVDIDAIRQVQQAVEEAMTVVTEYLVADPHPTAEQAHALIDRTLSAYDCESPHGHIVAAGTASAEPHEPGTGPIPAGVPIVIDIYPRSKTTGYYADMTRTVCIGEPSAELAQLYDTVLSAHTLAVSLVTPGVRGSDLQQAVETLFAEAGYRTSGTGTEFAFAEGFVHGLGHGVGTEIHLSPHIGRTSTDILSVGDVITIEPGLYYQHLGGVRLEDMLLVTESGAENLTHFPKQLPLLVPNSSHNR